MVVKTLFLALWMALSSNFILKDETHTERAVQANKTTLQLLDNVFKPFPVPKPTTVQFYSTIKYAYLGEYDQKHNLIKLYLSGKSSYEITELHEIGHWWNSHLSPNKKKLATEIDKDLIPWWNAVIASQKYQSLHASYVKVLKDPRKKDNVYYSIFKYGLNKNELFARSFTQWMCVKTKNPTLNYEIEPYVVLKDSLQWNEADFFPIYLVMDNYFMKKGLLR